MAQQVLSISQINEYIRTVMDRDSLLGNVAVRGEISNYKMYPSGHHYFTLKDEASALRCVIFKGNAMRLRFRPENGMKIIAVGKISVFPRDGAYQLYCTNLTPDGVGDLHVAFEQLKAKLGAQGLFAQEHKQRLPVFPGVIGIVTSSAGAAVHDMLRILKKRYPLTKVRLLPVRVQGVEAPAEIAAAIRYANRFNLADLLIVGRGGGSIEDLWAFNDERVAYAIYESGIPVISAVGHEPDVTISDYVADLRAATPSNAAELAVPDQDVLRQNLDSMQNAMSTVLSRQLLNARRHLAVLADSAPLRSPYGYFESRAKALELMKNRMISAQERKLSLSREMFGRYTAKLDAMSPLKVLSRGYSMTQMEDGTLVRSTGQLRAGEAIRIRLEQGVIGATVTDIREEA